MTKKSPSISTASPLCSGRPQRRIVLSQGLCCTCSSATVIKNSLVHILLLCRCNERVARRERERERDPEVTDTWWKQSVRKSKPMLYRETLETYMDEWDAYDMKETLRSAAMCRTAQAAKSTVHHKRDVHVCGLARRHFPQ